MNETRKWILHRVTAIILAPLYVLLYFLLVSLSTKGYSEATYFFENPLFKILTILVFFIGFFHAKISLSEIFEDYVQRTQPGLSVILENCFPLPYRRQRQAGKICQSLSGCYQKPDPRQSVLGRSSTCEPEARVEPLRALYDREYLYNIHVGRLIC